MAKLTLDIETLRELTPEDARNVNGGATGKVSSAKPPTITAPVSSAKPPTITAPVSSVRPVHHHHHKHH